ncbi:hypothetical protein [Paraburkholderia sp.]|uniref:hypothetical protein n=1 Tax=Paraburkholderia sp. TaxID=1926495 RepID=UPI003D6F6BCB
MLNESKHSGFLIALRSKTAGDHWNELPTINSDIVIRSESNILQWHILTRLQKTATGASMRGKGEKINWKRTIDG